MNFLKKLPTPAISYSQINWWFQQNFQKKICVSKNLKINCYCKTYPTRRHSNKRVNSSFERVCLYLSFVYFTHYKIYYTQVIILKRRTARKKKWNLLLFFLEIWFFVEESKFIQSFLVWWEPWNIYTIFKRLAASQKKSGFHCLLWLFKF